MIIYCFCVNLIIMKKIFKLAFAVSLLTFNSLMASFSESLSLDKVFASITEAKVTSGDFLQEKTSAKIKRPLKSSGKFVFSKDAIVWQTVKPFPSTTAVTSDTLIQIGADGKKSVVDGSTNETFKGIAATLSSIFAGNRAEIEKFFNIKTFESDAAAWKAVLTPKDATIGSSLKEISLSGSVKGSKATLDGMQILQNESDVTKYTLSNQVQKQELSVDEKALLKK